MLTYQKTTIGVIGYGNILLRDEGAGVHAVHMLQNGNFNYREETSVEIIDGGTLPGIIDNLGKLDKLIIIDAVQLGKKPGAIYRIESESINEEYSPSISLHQVSLLEELAQLKHFGRQVPKEIVIIGIEPEDIGVGLELSEAVKKSLPDLVNTVNKEINTIKFSRAC